MAISSVTSSTNPARTAQQLQAAQPTEEPAKTRQVRQQEEKTETPKPVVNERGESTGRVINTSA